MWAPLRWLFLLIWAVATAFADPNMCDRVGGPNTCATFDNDETLFQPITCALCPGIIRPPHCRATLLALLSAVSGLLEAASVPHWLGRGTLLGAVRDGRLLAWESDANIGVFAMDGQRAIDVLDRARPLGVRYEAIAATAGTGRGRTIVVHAHMNRGVRLRIEMVRLANVSGPADGDVEVPPSTALIPYCNARLFRDCLGDDDAFSSRGWIRARHLLPLGNVTLAGRVFPAPRKRKAVLARMFGADWGSPDRERAGAWAAPAPPVKGCKPVSTLGQAHAEYDRRLADVAGSHKYDLAHLVQPPSQRATGPIQDDEALFLFSIVRGVRARRVLEIGGLHGYSARNFLAATAIFGGQGAVFTVDVNPVRSQGARHTCIQKNALNLTAGDVGGKPVDLVFFDAHTMAQLDMYHAFVAHGIITDATILALHDTCLHPKQSRHGHAAFIPEAGGYEHQWVERQMVNVFQGELGYDVFHLHTLLLREPSIPYRHGVSVCQKRRRLLSMGPPPVAGSDGGDDTAASGGGGVLLNEGAQGWSGSAGDDHDNDDAAAVTVCTGARPLPRRCFRLME